MSGMGAKLVIKVGCRAALPSNLFDCLACPIPAVRWFLLGGWHLVVDSSPTTDFTFLDGSIKWNSSKNLIYPLNSKTANGPMVDPILCLFYPLNSKTANGPMVDPILCLFYPLNSKTANGPMVGK
ncbi:hypothetical protein SAY86_010705 [Trapa natans]|uniref:Uncharacterized protein n=1 Tax=Trapa natans TaxID=22666 RepID=A0AAN7R236_TRANT|nr:hypothetical protein SAY86_010705 [Trapa natans]